MSQYVSCKVKRPSSHLRLFCFPWAGGGTHFYASWGKDLPEDVEVLAICLPGRENRFREPLCSDGPKVVKEIAAIIGGQYGDKPFMFYGHSMGALLAFLVAVEVKHTFGREPESLFLSGTTAPHSPKRKANTLFPEHLTKEEFLDRIGLLGGTPAEVLEHPELMDIYYPPLRADMSLVPTLVYKQKPEDPPPLTCPIHFFDGADDIDHDMALWRQVTSGHFSFCTMPGGHFFLKVPDNTKRLLESIRGQTESSRLKDYEDIV